MTTAWTQMDALLTCELCGEHFRNPKQLPCQHTFCMEPCLERLVDRGQLKCPRCGTDFRVPFQGLSAFPNNVTLVRFLELRQSVSGEDPAPPASLLQCSVCRDRGPVQRCAHCGRKLCKECQKAHSQIVRREFNLVATEAKQAVTDLKDIYETTKKNTEKLQENYKAVKAEVEELANNFTNDILKTEQKMKYELDLYETLELRNMNTFQKSLEIEISNINSNCDLIDKYMNENVSWTDKELVEYKDMFQRTLEFLRYLDIDPSSDYARRVRFQPHVDTEAMHRTLQDWGEVGVQSPSPEPLIPRCQSDHRLAVPMSDDIMDDDDEDFPTAPSSVRRFEAPQTRKVTVTEDSTRGPLSGVSKLEDSPKVMERLHETEVRQKVEAEKVAREPPPAPTFAPPPPPTRVTRQVSEDDIDKQKRQNKAAAAEASEPAPRPRPAWRPPEPEPVVPKEKPPEVPSSTRPRSWRTETAEPAAPKDKPPVAPRATAQVVNKVPRLKPPEPEEEPAPARRVTYLTRTGSLERPDPPADGYRPTHSFSSRFLDKIRARREEEKEETPSASSASSAESDEEETTTARTRDDISPAVNALLARSAQARRDSARSHSLLEASRRPISRYARHSEREKSPERPDRRSRFRTAAMSRSKSSHELQPAEESQDEERPLSPYRSRYGRQENGSEDSWSQYLRNKYVRTRREQSDSENSSDEEQPARNPRRTYTQKGKLTLKFGTRGSEPGCFTWPRGVTSGPDNTIAVADSSNHRIQVFTGGGKFLHEFGTYGTGPGEFDSLAAVAVSKLGHFIVSDRYNHRIQVFDASGRFQRAFGSEGRADGKFNYPWGLATDSLGFIYVCDKENHRIQVFQADGTFVSKFGQAGTRPGCFENPHYVAVSSTNRVVVSDSNNHRVQLFDVNGRLLSTFGSEGSEEGQFKFPRGVAVDDQGFIFVGDSGNNRIQIFHPDGTFLKAFGSWGPGDGEFKGLEGIAVTPAGNILVCDRENHRIQVF